MFSLRLLATGLCVAALAAVPAVFWWRSANVGPVQRGADLAVAQGCMDCHGGPGVSPLLPRPFADLDDLDPVTLREWILDGMPLARAAGSRRPSGPRGRGDTDASLARAPV